MLMMVISMAEGVLTTSVALMSCGHAFVITIVIVVIDCIRYKFGL